MGLMIDCGGLPDEYEAIALPPADGTGGALGAAVFVRRSARPSRRAVLHLHDLTGSFAPADLARWYNERGFHFYVTDVDVADSLDSGSRRRLNRSLQAWFSVLDGACRHLREKDGIDAVILSAEGSAASPAALWCDARRSSSPVDALIVSRPDFGRGLRRSLDISCPVLVISASGGSAELSRRERRSVRLGQHVTWLFLDEDAGSDAAAASRQRLFDEMGRWLGAYMYGQVRDQLL
jgi:alpha-beta hydrolase superfamily lysophospholipase